MRADAYPLDDTRRITVCARTCVYTRACAHTMGRTRDTSLRIACWGRIHTRARTRDDVTARAPCGVDNERRSGRISPFFHLSLCSGSSRFTSAYYRFAVLSLSISFLLASPVERLTAFFLGWLRAARLGTVTPSTRRWIRSRAALTTSRVGTVTTGSEEDLPTSSRSRSRLEDTRQRVRRSRVDAINFPIRASLPVNDACRLAVTSDLSPIFVRQ